METSRIDNRITARLAGAALVCGMSLPAGPAQALETLFDISIGPRIDELHWSISGNRLGANPNILSELTWRSVDSVQLGLVFEAVSESGFTLRTQARVGQIYDGWVRDSDFVGNNRTLEVSRAEAETNDDSVSDVNISLGKRIPVTDTRATFVTPFVGFSFHQQDFRITDGVQIIDQVSGLGPRALVGLDSRYEAEWWSTYLGFQIDHFGQRWDTFGRVEYHNADYEASGDWNLRDDLAHPVSFKQKSDGSGPIYMIGTRYHFTDNWAFNASFSWANWDADTGVHRSLGADGRVTSTRLNTAQWEHNALMMGISYVARPR